jgi:DNA-binding NarL/FixJ family response regulator
MPAVVLGTCSHGLGDVEIQRALQAGARGYLLKNMPPSELLDVIRQVHDGKKRIQNWAPPIEPRQSPSAYAAASSNSSKTERISRKKAQKAQKRY